MSKKLEIKQRRREEAERREAERKAAARRRNLVTLAITLVVALIVGAAVFFQRQEEGRSDIGGSIASAGCDDIQTFEGAEAEDARGHVEDGQDVQYETNPPTYGPHYGTTSPTGFFDEPVIEEVLVHNLEHGQIVIHYSPDASQETKDKIDELVDQESQATVAVPTDNLEKPVVFTAWGAMQTCDEPAQAAADAFRERFQGRGPEQVGVPTFTG